MAVIDTILLFNELDLLEIRINELSSVVDKFIVIQSNKTFSGQNKRVYEFKDIKNIARFKRKVLFYNVTDMPGGDDPWIREKHQRNTIAKALKKVKAEDGDRVLISDVDEIPQASAVRKAAKFSNPILFKLRFFYYYINVRGVTTPWWPRLRMASVRDLIPEPQKIRDLPENDPRFVVLEDAGWHFSFLGGKERIKEKVAAFSHHYQVNNPKFMNDTNLENALSKKADLFQRKLPIFGHKFSFLGPKVLWKKVEFDNSYPKYLLKNSKKFDYMVDK